MVSLVIVSHSRKLAEGILELIEQMSQGKVPIAIAGGIEDPENPIGTDAMQVLEAIEEVYSEDGVLVLMDLGSAVLSAELAVEMLPPEHQKKVHLCAAPVVEGALSAAVQAAAGSPMDVVCDEARAALTPKYEQLGEEVPPTPATEAPSAPSKKGAVRTTLVIRNPLGLHARPAARFVTTAAQFTSEITVRNETTGAGPGNAKSIGQVARLGIQQDHEIAITAEGDEAAAAIAALTQLVEDNFGEPETLPQAPAEPERRPPAPSEPEAGRLKGLPVAPGIALAPAYVYRTERLEAPDETIADVEAELRKFDEALKRARRELETLYEETQKRAGAYEAEIFEAQRLYLDDPEILEESRRQIEEEHRNAAAAWESAIEETVAELRDLDDPYLRARSADVDDVGQRVLRLLLDDQYTPPPIESPCILVAEDLAPSDVAQIDTSLVQAICTALGGATSHTAILARALAIPAIVGLGEAILQIAAGTELAVDGEAGYVYVEPEAGAREELRARRESWQEEQETARAAAQAPATTEDGHRVEVVANIGSLADAYNALRYGAEGVGLLRTEFLYLDRQSPPDEEEQVEIYGAIADLLEERPFVIRTLDVGGDKPLPYVEAPPEANPFLGWRGIRIGLDREDLLTTQMRAILRASPGHQIKVMFPMVATLDEIRRARALWQRVQQELHEASVPFDAEIEVGIMVEIPAAAVMADQLIEEVDFFSIGTNDLSQYTYAADRTNARVSPLADAFNPAVLRLIARVIDAAHAAGRWVGLCGELAGAPLAAPILLGLGLDEFSMAPPAIPAVKQRLSRINLDDARALAQEALDLSSPKEIRELVERRLP